MGGEKKSLVMSDLGCADGCGWQMGWRELSERLADGVGAREWLEMGGEQKAPGMSASLDGVGARELLEMGGEKKLLGMSELGCADGCGRHGCKGVHGWKWVGEEAAGDERAWLRGRRGCKGREWLEMGGDWG